MTGHGRPATGTLWAAVPPTAMAMATATVSMGAEDLIGTVATMIAAGAATVVGVVIVAVATGAVTVAVAAGVVAATGVMAGTMGTSAGNR